MKLLWVGLLLGAVGFAGLPAFAVESATQPPAGYEELKIKLPRPIFSGTPKNPPQGMKVEMVKNLAPVFVPKGTQNVAKDKKVTASDMEPIIGDLRQITDGDKETVDGSFVELAPGLQWVQIDLGDPYKIHAIALWHFHQDPRVFKGVVVQISSDPDFIEGVKTVFNNDSGNTTGLGVGKDMQYFETHEGRVIPVKGIEGRYVRCYSKGNTADLQSQYIEVEVYGQKSE